MKTQKSRKFDMKLGGGFRLRWRHHGNLPLNFRGGFQMMTNDDERGEAEGGKKCPKFDDVICERPLNTASIIHQCCLKLLHLPVSHTTCKWMDFIFLSESYAWEASFSSIPGNLNFIITWKPLSLRLAGGTGKPGGKPLDHWPVENNSESVVRLGGN